MVNFEHYINESYVRIFLFLPFIIWHPVADNNRDSFIFIAIGDSIKRYPTISGLSVDRNVSSFHRLEVMFLCAFFPCLREILVKNG